MPDDLPLAAAYAFLAVVAFCRGGATYAVGRLGRRAGSASERASRLLERPSVQRAERTVRHWGAPVVALSFLTIGFQTAVNAAAGVLEMPLRRYLPGLLVGALLWAGVYVSIGFAVLNAWLTADGGLWLLGAAAVVLLVVLLTRWLRRRTSTDERA